MGEAEISDKGAVARKKYEQNLPAICVAIEEQKFELLCAFLSQLIDLQIDPSDPYDVVLFYVASVCGSVELLEKFRARGFPVVSPLKTIHRIWPYFRNFSGFTGLHFTFMYLRLDASKFLLDQGANVFIPDDLGITPLRVLFETKKQMLEDQSSLESYDRIVDLILQTKEQRESIVPHFHIACTRDEPETIQNFLLNGACVDQTVGAFSGHEGFSPLHFAVQYKCVKVVDLLLKSGANVSLTDHENRTALHLTESPELAQLLLQYETDLTLNDSNGNAPLRKALKERNFNIMHSLLLANANSNTIDQNKDLSKHNNETEEFNDQNQNKNLSKHNNETEDFNDQNQNKDSSKHNNETEDFNDQNVYKDCYKKFCPECKNILPPENTNMKCQTCDTLIQIQCERCFKLFKKHQSIIAHLNSNCKRNKHFFKCTECSYFAKSQFRVYYHWKEKHAKSDFEKDGLTMKQRITKVTRRKKGTASGNSIDSQQIVEKTT